MAPFVIGLFRGLLVCSYACVSPINGPPVGLSMADLISAGLPAEVDGSLLVLGLGQCYPRRALRLPLVHPGQSADAADASEAQWSRAFLWRERPCLLPELSGFLEMLEVH